MSVCLVGTSKLLWTASGCSLYPHCLSVSFSLVARHLALRTATKDHRISLLTAKHSGHSLVSESFHETHKDEWISCTNNIYLACAHYTRNTPNGTIYIKLSHIGFNMVGVSGCMKVASNAQFCPFWCRQVTVNVPCYSITLRKTSSLFFPLSAFTLCVCVSLCLWMLFRVLHVQWYAITIAVSVLLGSTSLPMFCHTVVFIRLFSL